MKMIALALTLLVSAGCVSSRHLTIPDATPVLDAPEVTARWGVTELFVRSRPADTGGNGQRDYKELQTQLETRLRRTLEAQTRLGHRAEDADYGVEVQVDVHEASGVNGWLALGAGMETAVLLGGAGLGMAVGGPPASLLGLLVATPVALVVALAPPSHTELGEFEATVVLRRKADGVVVATRRTRSSWRAEMNGYHQKEKLARESGGSVPELERKILETLREALKDQTTPSLSSRGGEGQGEEANRRTALRSTPHPDPLP
jgi:hypothetical protein